MVALLLQHNAQVDREDHVSLTARCGQSQFLVLIHGMDCTVGWLDCVNVCIREKSCLRCRSLLHHDVQVDIQNKVSLASCGLYSLCTHDMIHAPGWIYRTDACILLWMCISGRYVA